MAGRSFLFIPGPTNIPDRVARAMVGAMEDHRSSAFPELSRGVLTDLRKIFKTEKGTPILFPATGTGGWEATLSNVLSPGDGVLAARHGQFSTNWSEMARRLGLQVEAIDCEWGEGVPVERYLEILEKDKAHRIKAVLATHCETSTGRGERHRRRAPRDGCREASRAVARGHRQLARLHRLPHGRMGRRHLRHRFAEGPDAADRPLPALRQREGARREREGHAAALLLRLRQHAPRQCDRLLPLHAGDVDAPRPARLARPDPGRRARERLPPPPLSRLRRARRRPERLEARPVRQGAEVVLRHGHRHRGAGGHRRGER